MASDGDHGEQRVEIHTRAPRSSRDATAVLHCRQELFVDYNTRRRHKRSNLPQWKTMKHSTAQRKEKSNGAGWFGPAQMRKQRAVTHPVHAAQQTTREATNCARGTRKQGCTSYPGSTIAVQSHVFNGFAGTTTHTIAGRFPQKKSIAGARRRYDTPESLNQHVPQRIHGARAPFRGFL